jgi:hypothetical protein
MACEDRCSLWRVYSQSFVTIIPEIEFSLFVVFSIKTYVARER